MTNDAKYRDADGNWTLPFTTKPTPGSGTDWKPIFARVRAARVSDVPPPLRDAYVVTEGHQTPLRAKSDGTLSRVGTLGKVAAQATELGWEVKHGESDHMTAEKWIKSRRVVEPGKLKHHEWIEMAKPSHRLTYSEEGYMVDREWVTEEAFRKVLGE